MDALLSAGKGKAAVVVGSTAGAPIRIRSLRLLKRNPSCGNATQSVCHMTSDYARFLTCHGRAMHPRPLMASHTPSTLQSRSSMLRSFPVCMAVADDGSGAESASNGFHNMTSSKPSVWNASFRNRINKVAGDYTDYSLSAGQGAMNAACDGHDSMQGINGDRTSSDLGGGDGGGKGTGDSGGGSGNDGFGFGGLGGDDGFFIAGMGSWVVIAAAIGALTSVLAQIFRGAGRPTSRHKKGSSSVDKTSTTSNFGIEKEGVQSWVHQGGSLSHASRGAFRGFMPNPPNRTPIPDPTTAFVRFVGYWCEAAESAKIHYRGLFTRTLYPPPEVHAGAFYRQHVGLVGPEPGDWVEDMEAEEEDHNKSLENTVHCVNATRDGVFQYGEKGIDSEPVQNPEELSVLKEQLHRVQQLLKDSEKRRVALEDIKESNDRDDSLEQSLRAQIKVQEAMNKQIRARLEHLCGERNALMNVLDQAKGTLAGVFPDMEESTGQIDDLNKAVKTHKTNLRLMEKQLNVTSRERDAVLRRMDALQRDVNDIESLLDIVEKSRELVCQTDSEEYAEKIRKAEACIQVLQQYLLKPTGSRHLSPIREVGNRVVVTFEKLMIELKRGFIQASKYIKQLEGVQSKLSQNSQDETKLASQLTELKAQYDRLAEEKSSIEKTLETVQTTLAEAQENLDGSSRQETELREKMEQLTCDKDTLSAMMHSIQREASDIENLTQIMEKTRELILNTEPAAMGMDHVTTLDNCMTALQQHHLKPTEPYDHVSRNISDRLVRVFENLLIQTKQSFVKALESKGALKRVEDDLEGALSEESSLSITIEGLRTQLNDMTTAKCSLSNDVQMLKNELDEKALSLDQLRMELTSLDEVREEQNKDIEQLRQELDEKKKLLDESKQAEAAMQDALYKIGEERDLLSSKLETNEDALGRLNGSLEQVLAEGKLAQEQLDALQAEKSNLETQLAGLTHRIKDFETENSRLNAVAQTLRSNLDHERREKEQLEQEAEDLSAERSDLHERFMGQIETLKGKLDNKQEECKQLEATCVSLEETKARLEKSLEEENTKYNEQMEQLKRTYKGDALLTGSANSDPLPPVYAESPFAQQDREGPSVAQPSGEGHPMNEDGEGSDLTVPGEEIEAEYTDAKPGENKVLTWLDDAEVDPWGVMPSDRDTSATAPPLEQESSQILGNLMPSAGPICERRIHRRLSWPQDMTVELNDNLFGAAQELAEMTTATLELAAEKNVMESELNEVRQAINEARGQLEEREKEVSDLTEHFLQVYQIASDLAADNEEQSTELRELRLTYKKQQQDIECRDQRIAMLETEFAMANMAPPRSTIMTNHFAETDDNFAQSVTAEPRRPSFANSDYSDGNGRLRSVSSLGLHPEIQGYTSPRFDAPGTPSVFSAALDGDHHLQRGTPSATTTNVAIKNYGEPEGEDLHYSFSDMSSLSGVEDDGSDIGYPDSNH